jgi:hypothetical protein
MFMGTVMVASVTAVVTWYLTKTDALEQSTRETTDMLAAMMEHYQIPWELQVEIIQLLPAALATENEARFTQLIHNMPGFIVTKVEGYTRSKVLKTSIPLFADLPDDSVLALASCLQQKFVQADADIIPEGGKASEMYFLVRGVAAVVIFQDSEEVLQQLLRSQAFFGEKALQNETEIGSSAEPSVKVVAVTLCELLMLAKKDFDQLISNRSDLKAKFVEAVFKPATQHPAQRLPELVSSPVVGSSGKGFPITGEGNNNPLSAT